MKENLVGIIRFKILTSTGPYYFWKIIKDDLNALEIIKSEKNAASQIKFKERSLFEKCLASNAYKITCTPICMINEDNLCAQALIVINDMASFAPSEVLPGSIPFLFAYSQNFGIDASGKLMIIDKNVKDLNNLISLMQRYPQIDFGMSYQKEELISRIKNIKKLIQDNSNNKKYRLEYSILLHWFGQLDTNLQQKLLNIYDFQPFNLDSVKLNQDHKVPLFFKDYYPSHYLSFRRLIQQRRDRNPHHVELYQSIDNQFMELSGLKYKFEESEVEDTAQRENSSHKNDLANFLAIKLPTPNPIFAKTAIQKYSKLLLSLLNNQTKKPIMMAAIPSHKKTIKNIVSRIVEHLANTTLYIKNGNEFIVKNHDEQAAHNLKGTKGRNSKKHEATLSSERNPSDYEKSLPLIIIDDMSTTGSSMEAATNHFRKLGFKHIYNFIFGMSIPYISIKDFHPELKNFDGIVFDLDQTIYDSAHTLNGNPARLYFPDLFKKLESNNIKVVFVTQSSYKNVRQYCDDQFLLDHLFTEKQSNYLSTVHVGPNGEKYYKPSGVTIREAVKRYLNNCKNIIGIGNNETDILAYTNAGIDTALAEWGNPIKGVPTKANYRLKNETELLNLLLLN